MGRHYVSTVLFVLAAATSQCPADEPADTESIISVLIDVTKDSDAGVRYAAFNALKTQPRSEQILELFWRGLEDDLLQIRTLSLDRIVALEGPTDKVLERLVLLMNKRRDGEDQALARQARSRLVSLGAPAIPYLTDAIKKDETNYYAIHALGSIPLGEYRATVTAQLTGLLKSENKDVRLSAVQTLQSIMSADARAKAQAEATARAKTTDEARYLAYYAKVLQKYDSNADGSLTKDEWSKMSRDPAAADADEDGKITLAELAKWSMSR